MRRKRDFAAATFITLWLLSGCDGTQSPSNQSASGLSCKGIYTTTDSQGNLKKFNEYERAGQCWTDNLALSRLETTQENWRKAKVTCVPQPGFASRTVVSANNFYSYRDGRVLLDFDSATGIYRRLTLGEDANGKSTYSKLQGCFYQKTGTGVDAPSGRQLLLDTDVTKIITSQYTDLMEIFSYSETASALNLVRFDVSADWTYLYCSEFRTPWEYCTKLRNGNDMYYPVLSSSDQTGMLNQAILIRKIFNYATYSKSAFDSQWSNVEQTRTEAVQEDLLYDVIQNVDTPRFIASAWRSYVMGTRPTIPNTSSSRMPPICYHGSQTVTLASGATGKVYGQICYTSTGGYSFVQ